MKLLHTFFAILVIFLTTNISITPQTLDFWKPVKTFLTPKGDVAAFAENEFTKELFAVKLPGIVKKSTDKGFTWEVISSTLPTELDVKTIAVDQNNKIFIGSLKNGVYLSEDNGISWSQINSGITDYNGSVNANFIKADLNNSIYLAATGGFYRFDGATKSWTHLYSPIDRPTEEALCLYTGNTGYIIVGFQWSWGAFSMDYGKTWDTFPNVGSLDPLTVLEQRAQNIIYFSQGPNILTIEKGKDYSQLISTWYNAGFIIGIASDGDGNSYLTDDLGDTYKSTNSGATWTKISHFDFNLKSFFYTSEGYILIGSPTDGSYISTDFGKNWISINAGDILTSRPVTTLMVGANNDLFMTQAEIPYLMRSTDNGTNWEQVKINGQTYVTDEEHIYDVDGFFSDKNNHILCYSTPFEVVGLSSVLFESTDNGATWKKKDAPTFKIIKSVKKIGEYIYVCESSDEPRSGGLWRSSNWGDTWEKINIGFDDDLVNDIFTDSNGTLYIVTGFKYGVLKSTDQGNNWIKFIDPPGNAQNLISGYPTDNGLLICNPYGYFFKCIEENSGTFGLDKPISTGRFNSDETGIIFCGSGSIGLANGQLWLPIDIPNGEYQFVIDKDRYAYTTGGNCIIYRSKDKISSMLLERPTNIKVKTTGNMEYEITWSDNSENEDGFVIFRKNDGEYFYNKLDSVSAGITKYSFSTSLDITKDSFIVIAYNSQFVSLPSPEGSLITGIKENDEIVPTEFALFQNYPNPFNPVTVIKYSIPATGFVRLTLYDILGRKISTLINSEQSPGIYEVKLNAHTLASGVYFYKLESGSLSSIKKFLLLK